MDPGIWGRLEIEIIARQNRGRKRLLHSHELESNVSQTITSGLVTLFILCAWVVAGAGMCFGGMSVFHCPLAV